MRKLFLIFTTFFCFSLYSQNGIQQKISEAKTLNASKYFSPFSILNTSSNTSIFKANNSTIQLNFDAKFLKEIENQSPVYFNLTIPNSINQNIELELIPHNIFDLGFTVIDGNDNEIQNISKGKFYIGIVKGEPHSVVSLSVLNGELNALISFQGQNFELSKPQNESNYTFFKQSDLNFQPTFNCFTAENNEKIEIQNNSLNLANVTCQDFGVYIEADFESFQTNSSNIQNTTNWVNNIFSKVATLYVNEGLNLVLSQLKIWNTGNPATYNSATSTGELLSAFDSHIGSTFTGNIAHLFSSRTLGGGIAWTNTLCVKSYAHGVSTNLTSITPSLPTTSWNVYCVAHEIGHTFGSPHTHSCSWSGGPIDNCAVPEGNCTAGPTPTNGGTIMSYCHTNYGIGVNFANGFGILPGNLIRQKAQICVGTANPPTNLTSIDVYSNAAILSWNPNFGMNGATLDYRLIGVSSWTTINSLTVNYKKITGLTANSNYEWRMKRDCSNYSTVANFSTNNTLIPNWCDNSWVNNCNGNGVNLDKLELNSQLISNNSGCNDLNSNLFFNTIQTFETGQSYNFTINFGNNQVPIHSTIWIDFNKNGTFESIEKMYSTSIPTNNAIQSGSFTIPSNLISISRTRMRIICTYSTIPTDPCGSYNYGEAEDYIVNIQNNCIQNLVLQSSTDDLSNGNNIKEANAATGTINASNKITGTASVIYRAGKSIEFKPGFVAEKGTVFKTEFGGCN